MGSLRSEAYYNGRQPIRSKRLERVGRYFGSIGFWRKFERENEAAAPTRKRQVHASSSSSSPPPPTSSSSYSSLPHAHGHFFHHSPRSLPLPPPKTQLHFSFIPQPSSSFSRCSFLFLSQPQRHKAFFLLIAEQVLSLSPLVLFLLLLPPAAGPPQVQIHLHLDCFFCFCGRPDGRP